jgi:translation initiation factor 2B subunit (eIF-2B alpha/beta/delta family)
MELDQRLQRLRTDNTSGAVALLGLAIDILEIFAEQPDVTDQQDFHTALTTLTRTLIAAQPSMAPMINLAQHVLRVCPEHLSPSNARQRLRQCLAEVRQQIRLSIAALCEHTLTIIPPQASMLTYSNSSVVIAALRYAYDCGRLQRVMLSESRPAYDGRPQATALLQHGIAVEYSIDMALFECLPEAQLVVVGADAVFPHGVVNKLGTHALAQMAAHHHVPIYSLCTTNKFLPAAAASLLQITEHAADEVWPEAPVGLDIRNHYFDTTPLDLFSGIVCEDGVMSPAALRTRLQRQTLSVALQSLG